MAVPQVNTAYIKAQIDSARTSIGRTVTIYTPKLSACVECVASGFYDPVSDTSYYVTCPTCNGLYWLAQMDATDVLARVHWVSNEGIAVTPGGKYFLGEAQITVDPSYLTLLEDAQSDSGKVVIDGQDMSITKINPLGAPEVNRVRAILKSMGGRPDNNG